MKAREPVQKRLAPSCPNFDPELCRSSYLGRTVEKQLQALVVAKEGINLELIRTIDHHWAIWKRQEIECVLKIRVPIADDVVDHLLPNCARGFDNEVIGSCLVNTLKAADGCNAIGFEDQFEEVCAIGLVKLNHHGAVG